MDSGKTILDGRETTIGKPIQPYPPLQINPF